MVNIYLIVLVLAVMYWYEGDTRAWYRYACDSVVERVAGANRAPSAARDTRSIGRADRVM